MFVQFFITIYLEKHAQHASDVEVPAHMAGNPLLPHGDDAVLGHLDVQYPERGPPKTRTQDSRRFWVRGSLHPQVSYIMVPLSVDPTPRLCGAC